LNQYGTRGCTPKAAQLGAGRPEPTSFRMRSRMFRNVVIECPE
jgi:hypothetical protein